MLYTECETLLLYLTSKIILYEKRGRSFITFNIYIYLSTIDIKFRDLAEKISVVERFSF